MSRRLSIQYKTSAVKSQKPKVKFPDELVFLESIKDNDIENVRTMLRRASLNMDINKINISGLTPLHQAVLDDSVEVVRLLIENKANVNSVDEDSWTPLHAAASMGYYDVAKYLLENGADPLALTSDGERPIDLVEQDDQENFSLISLLLNHMNNLKISNGEENDDENDIEAEENLERLNAKDNRPASKKSDSIESPEKRSLKEQSGVTSPVKNLASNSTSSMTNKPAAKLSNSSNTSITTSEYFHGKILAILRTKSDNKKKIAEIENVIKEDANFSKSKQFFRSLMMAFCEFCMINNKEFDVDSKELKDKAPVLVRFLENSDEKKIECLHAIYDLNTKINNPPNLLRKLFLNLNEAKVVSKETFELWTDNAEIKYGDKFKLSFNFKDFK